MQPRIMFLMFLFFLGALGSCQKEKLPAGVLTPEQFSTVLIDIYLAQARLSSTLAKRDSADMIFKPYEEKILKSHAVADSTMKKTYEYYLTRPKDLEKIYDVVIDTLALREQRVKTTQSAKPAEPQ